MKLFSPAKIGSLALPNRVVMAPISTNFPSITGEVTPELTNFYLERALGGVGMIILEWANIDYPLGKSGYTQLRIDDDSFIPSLSQFTEVIHETDTKICLQLNHAGGMFGDRARAELDPISASALVYSSNGRKAREASIDEIRTIQQKFILAAERAKMAGFDCIELHGATSYLISNFLSSWTNLRTDQYGGNVENRARFAVEIIRGIRQKCGPAYPILFRISGDEMHPKGRRLEETADIVNLLKAAGADCMHVTAGAGRSPKSTARRAHICPMGYPQGWKSYLAREIGQRCDITTIAVGSVRDVEIAEKIVNEDADFVAMARQLVADPAWVDKAKSGGNIRKCISCNSCLLHRSIYGSKLRCCVNPMAGKEYRLAPPEKHPAQNPKKVAIIGGGPAGMEAARVATLRGHHVTLFEKSARLGGYLLPAAGTDIKYKITWLTEWLSKEMETLKVDVRLGVEVTASMLENSKYDVILIATGSNERMFSPVREYVAEKGASASNLLFATDYLGDSRKIPEGAKEGLVLGAGLIGCEASYKLAQHGLHVRVLEGYRTKDNLIAGFDLSNGMELIDAMAEVGVEIIDHTHITAINEREVQAVTLEQPITYPYDVVLIAQGFVPADRLVRELSGLGKPIIPIGNVNLDRTIFYAMHEGFASAYRL
ncbi:NADH oxidase [Synergistales bacterium]|nr:NADH oxidase [Synergistales bacterium]